LLIAGGIDFDVSIDEDQRRPSGGADPGPHYHRGWEMTVADGFCSCSFLLALLEQYAIVERLNGENFLIKLNPAALFVKTHTCHVRVNKTRK